MKKPKHLAHSASIIKEAGNITWCDIYVKDMNRAELLSFIWQLDQEIGRLGNMVNKTEIRLPAKLVEFYKEIAGLAGLPVEVVMTVVLAVGAWRELNKGKSK